MRDCEKNLISMKYATYSDKITIYVRDDNGNIIYDDIDGEKIPRVASETAGYDLPVMFEAEFAMSGEAQLVEYGVSNGRYEAVVSTTNKSLPIDEKSLIWKDSEPIINNDVVDIDSADYSVYAKKPSLNEVKFLLQKKTKGE